ncbi:GGDEF domain-containing protein [Butyrivibrio sp. NC3005]|uniref:GGDEF domain-containing protein n=1 Tax=Butyrivibrio sp. NC3005 TaxID=1280685 RepID=UPI000417EC00|nr:GGDEF domain-containing protein [Butyrivibrio sp. NC3005]
MQTKKLNVTKKYIICFFLAALIPLLLLAFNASVVNTKPQYEITVLDTGWTLQKNEANPIMNVNIASPNLGTTLSGDVLTISHKIPDFLVPGSAIVFRTAMCTVNVYIEDNLVESFGQDYDRDKKIPPKHFVYIPLSKNHAGKTIRIEFTVVEDYAVTGFSKVYYGNVEDISSFLLQEKRMHMFIGIFLIVFGIEQFVLSIKFFKSLDQDISPFFSSLISTSLGCYILCYYSIFCHICNNDYLFTLLEYLTLFTIPIGIFGFMISGHISYGKKFLNILITCNLLFLLTTTILNFSGIMHYCHFITLMHIGSLIESIYAIYILIRSILNNIQNSHSLNVEYYESTAPTNVLLLGAFLFVSCSIFEIAKYDMLKFFSPSGEFRTDISFITMGALFFVICVNISYSLSLVNKVNSKNIKSQLEGIAYTDPLTGLANRSRCEQILESLTNSKNYFAIISIDLDHLKAVNDTFGHTVGDTYIITLSNMLKSTFEEPSVTGRMGGDEFIVIMPYSNRQHIKTLLASLSQKKDDYNANNPDIKLSFSYGVAYRTNFTQSSKDIYNMADNNMYKMKALHHNSNN